MQTEQQKDEALWAVAKARVGFRWSLVSYLVVNAFLVAVWFFTAGPEHYFWPIWPILGWGLGLGLQYVNAYQVNRGTSIQREFDKLKNK